MKIIGISCRQTCHFVLKFTTAFGDRGLRPDSQGELSNYATHPLSFVLATPLYRYAPLPPRNCYCDLSQKSSCAVRYNQRAICVDFRAFINQTINIIDANNIGVQHIT